MKKILPIVLFLTVIAFEPIFSQVIQDNEEIQLEAFIYESAYLENQVDEAISVLEGLLEQLSPDNDSRSIVKVLTVAFEHERMRQISTDYISLIMNENFANEIVRFLEDESMYYIHKSVFNANLDLDDPEIVVDFESYIEMTDIQNRSDERIDIVQDIIRLTRLIPTSLQRLEDILTAVMFGLNIALPAEEQVSGEELNELIITLRANFRQLYDNITPAFILYATRNADIDDLKTYRHFLNTPAGSWYIRIINRASLNSFDSMSDGASRLVADWAIERAELEEERAN